MKKILGIACISLVTAGLVGCSAKAELSTKAETPPPPPAEPAPEPEPEPEPEPKKVYQHVKITDDHLEIDQKIHFGNDSAEIQADSNELLDEIATVLKEHGEIGTVHIVGHTDTNGDDNHNKDLSQRRADAVVKALRDRGVEQEIDARGAGEEELACTDDTPECHEKNRRVEFVIEKKG